MADSVWVGDRVRWVSAEGTLRGEIKKIKLDRNAKQDLVPWITIEYMKDNRPVYTVLCGTEENLTMLAFRVNFRDQ